MAQHSPAQPPLTWHIAGKGAIGLLAACHLTDAGIPVQLLQRQPLTQYNVDFAGRHYRFNAATLHTLHKTHPPIQTILVPVKSYDVVEAITGFQSKLSADAQLVLSHNGMGTIEQVLPLLQSTQGLWFLTTTHGALKQGQTLTHTGFGQSILSPLNSAAKTTRLAISSAMQTALGPLQLTENIWPFLWQKLAINAVINPLTALHNCKNGALADAVFSEQIQALLQEICQLAKLSGINMVFAEITQKVQQVIQSTSANYSSMRQDVAHQRRTENDAISGFIVRQGARFGLSLPHNKALYSQMQALEQRYRYQG